MSLHAEEKGEGKKRAERGGKKQATCDFRSANQWKARERHGAFYRTWEQINKENEKKERARERKKIV